MTATLGGTSLRRNFTLTITHEDDHLFEQATGQATFQIYPDSDRDHFLKVIDVQITFVIDNKGQATELILHQGGVDQRATRIE